MQPHILITGSTRGIGAAAALSLEARGARVVRHGSKDADGVIGAYIADPMAAQGAHADFSRH